MLQSLQKCLYPVAAFYGTLTRLERFFFGAFQFLVGRPRATVVSIGNLSVGGTGKTPLLMDLLNDPLRPPETVVLTRGYRSRWERGFYLLRGRGPHPDGLTDEALMVNLAFPDIPLFIGKNRAHTAAMAEKWFQPRLILLDDGFQYRRLARDLDLVLWDATMDQGDARLLPMGRLREPSDRLADAGVILLTRCETATAAQRAAWHEFLRSQAPRVPVVETATVPTGWLDPGGGSVALTCGPRRAFAFAAIANPGPFFSLLEKTGCAVPEHRSFRDHHVFTPSDLTAVADGARKYERTAVCTEKDRVKIDPVAALEHNIWTLRTAMRTTVGEPVSTALRRLGKLP